MYLGRVAHPRRKRIRARGNCKITGEGRGAAAREIGWLCINVRTRAFPVGVSARRGYTRLSSTFPTPLITPPIISWTITDEKERGGGGGGTWLFIMGWGEKGNDTFDIGGVNCAGNR